MCGTDKHCMLLHRIQIQYQDFQQQEGISKICHPGIVTNFIYKVVELATYTSAFATDAINILTGNTLNTGGHSTRQNYGYEDDENVYDHKKKDVSFWGENVETVEDEELPPPYDNSWSMTFTQDYPTTQTEAKPSLTISQQDYPTTQTELNLQLQFTQTSQKIVSTPTHSPTNSTSRRRQFRVRRGRRFIRRKSSSVDMSNISDTHSDSNVDDDEDIILKRLNYKISVMIAEAEAALNSKVEVTEVENLK
ncbi:unnamed protein product [Rhizophagus irregularis]|nr:unnamed protein product [Rhizophagus irregularis]